VVGELLDDVDDLAAGRRVVLSSVLACAARGEEPPCANCAAGDYGRCDRVTVGELKAGLQTGYCSDVTGGWSRMMLAHRSQLVPIPDAVDDRSAVLIEPLACATTALCERDGQASVFVRAPDRRSRCSPKILTQAGHVTVAAKHTVSEPRRWRERTSHPQARGERSAVRRTR
jgi:NADPH:quinone reductase-like Zn-dependent oxidoreductase